MVEQINWLHKVFLNRSFYVLGEWRGRQNQLLQTLLLTPWKRWCAWRQNLTSALLCYSSAHVQQITQSQCSVIRTERPWWQTQQYQHSFVHNTPVRLPSTTKKINKINKNNPPKQIIRKRKKAPNINKLGLFLFLSNNKAKVSGIWHVYGSLKKNSEKNIHIPQHRWTLDTYT